MKRRRALEQSVAAEIDKMSMKEGIALVTIPVSYNVCTALKDSSKVILLNTTVSYLSFRKYDFAMPPFRHEMGFTPELLHVNQLSLSGVVLIHPRYSIHLIISLTHIISRLEDFCIYHFSVCSLLHRWGNSRTNGPVGLQL